MKSIISLIAVVLILFSNSVLAQSWRKTNGPYGGSIKCLELNSSDDIFVGTAAGLFKSIDNGENWTHASNSLGSDYIYLVTIN